jgi:hypothetical protein
MLIVNGFFENGVFTPDMPLTGIKGRQKAVLNIEEKNETTSMERIKAWEEFSRVIRASDEILEGVPERIRFKTPEEISINEICA